MHVESRRVADSEEGAESVTRVKVAGAESCRRDSHSPKLPPNLTTTIVSL